MQPKTTNLLDLMTPEDRAKVLKRESDRIVAEAEKSDITPEVYITAEFGYYFGWPGIMAIKENTIPLDEVYALLDAVRKVWAKKVLDLSSANLSANAAVYAKDPSEAFKKSMQYTIKEAEL